MNQFSKSGFPSFDPSSMDPKLLMEISQLVQQLPPEKLQKIQGLMSKMMTGQDVQSELEEFENSLPYEIRQKFAAIAKSQGGGPVPRSSQSTAPSSSAEKVSSSTDSASSTNLRYLHPEVQPGGKDKGSRNVSDAEMDLRQARMTILRAVADGKMGPEEAEQLLFFSET